MKSEKVRRRVSKDIFCSSSGLSSKLIDGPECASMRLVIQCVRHLYDYYLRFNLHFHIHGRFLRWVNFHESGEFQGR